MKLKYYLRGCGLGLIVAVIILSVGIKRRGLVQMNDTYVMQRASQLGMVLPGGTETQETQKAEDTQNTETDTEADVKVSETEYVDKDGKVVSVKDTQVIAKSGDQKENSEKAEDAKSTASSQKRETAKPADTTAKSTDAKPKDTAAKSTDTKPTDTAAKSTDTKPADTAAKSTDTKPADTAAKSTDTKEPDKSADTAKPTEDTSDDETVSFTIRRGEYCRAIADKLYQQGLIPDSEQFRLYMQDSGYDNYIQVGTFQLKKNMEYLEIAKIITGNKR